MKTLVIAEKPSVARDIARVLNCSKKCDGYICGENYIVSWAIGHLVTLAEPEDYDASLKKWNYSNLPIIPEKIKLKAIKKTYPQYKILKSLMNSRDIDTIICATDSGREGELIFRYIYEFSKCKKPFKRLWISSMTDEAIKKGFENIKDGKNYDLLYKSAKCRSEADWLVGINATRAYTLKYNALLSIGRVQTPTLALIVSRQNEIDSFVPKDYWEVENNYGYFKGMWFSTENNDTKIFDKQKAEDICQKVNNQNGKVISIKNEKKQTLPPLLYDLTELQRDCNKKFGFSAQKTLNIVQSLYETKKAVTYPRTDSRYLSNDMVHMATDVLAKLSSIDEYKPFTESAKGFSVTKRVFNDSKVTDHHAIIPTNTYIKKSSLTPDELNVFNIIAIRFIAVFLTKYIYESVKIITEVCQEKFITKGNIVISEGWTAIYKALDKSSSNKKDDVLPKCKEGENVFVEKSEVLSKKTQPPSPYTEATLLSSMENAGKLIEDEEIREQMKASGLGTPATRAAIIERIISVGYVERKGKSLIPTEKGKKLVEIVPIEMKSAETTGKWEKGLNSIQNGKMSDERFMESIKRYVNFLVETSKNQNINIVFESEGNKNIKSKIRSIGKCPICGGKIYENTKAFYCEKWREGCKFTVWKNSLEKYGRVIDKKALSTLLKDKKIKDLDITLPQTGEKCTADLVFNKYYTGVELSNLNRKATSK